MSQKVVNYNPGFSEKWVLYLSPQAWRGRVKVEFADVPLSSLEPAGCCTDPNVVNGWIRILEAGNPVPPPVAVLTERSTYYLHDGNHRFEALAHFLADTDEVPSVRVAVAVPLPGHEFVYRRCEGYGTYMIQDCPLRFTTTAKMVIAILASAVALLVTAWLPAIDHTPMYALLVLSVMIAAWAGGWKAGMLAAMLNSAGVAYFLLPPNGSLLIAKPDQAVHFAVTALVMVAVAILMQIVRLHPIVEIGLRTEAVQSQVPTLRRGQS